MIEPTILFFDDCSDIFIIFPTFDPLSHLKAVGIQKFYAKFFRKLTSIIQSAKTHSLSYLPL